MAKTTTKELYSKCIILGSGTDKIILEDSTIFTLLHLTVNDLKWDVTSASIKKLDLEFPSTNYFDIPLEWFNTSNLMFEQNELLENLDELISIDSDFGLFYFNLCSLHKRRVKYQNILSAQPRPTMEQVGPRGLLEFGLNNTELLSNWMIWRKWIFDIDNRSGQETGYLFEPILASCLGGVSISSSKSPVKRVDSDGKPTKGGRQIDCYVASENRAYEFKLRVTIAASGQGRFAEELSFPKEAQIAGILPILLVLDSTPSNRLTELAKAFTDAGGESYIGEDAWNHMEEKSGDIIAVFIEKYIKQPLLTIAENEPEVLENIQLSWNNGVITISTENDEYVIKRT